MSELILDKFYKLLADLKLSKTSIYRCFTLYKINYFINESNCIADNWKEILIAKEDKNHEVKYALINILYNINSNESLKIASEILNKKENIEIKKITSKSL
jgi:hypothetical protein